MTTAMYPKSIWIRNTYRLPSYYTINTYIDWCRQQDILSLFNDQIPIYHQIINQHHHIYWSLTTARYTRSIWIKNTDRLPSYYTINTYIDWCRQPHIPSQFDYEIPINLISINHHHYLYYSNTAARYPRFINLNQKYR